MRNHSSTLELVAQGVELTNAPQGKNGSKARGKYSETTMAPGDTSGMQVSEEDTSGAPREPVIVPRLPGIASQVIGERMRAMYAELVREPVPDHFIALIQKLEQKERAR